MVQLAQVNVAKMLAPTDDPVMAEFVENLEPINALADAAPGFIWRLQTADGDATSLRVFDDTLIIVNMSVWTSVEALKSYVYKSRHVDFVRRRKAWFERFVGMHYALWWVPKGHIPDVLEAKSGSSTVNSMVIRKKRSRFKIFMNPNCFLKPLKFEWALCQKISRASPKQKRSRQWESFGMSTILPSSTPTRPTSFLISHLTCLSRQTYSQPSKRRRTCAASLWRHSSICGCKRSWRRRRSIRTSLG